MKQLKQYRNPWWHRVVNAESIPFWFLVGFATFGISWMTRMVDGSMNTIPIFGVNAPLFGLATLPFFLGLLAKGFAAGHKKRTRQRSMIKESTAVVGWGDWVQSLFVLFCGYLALWFLLRTVFEGANMMMMLGASATGLIAAWPIAKRLAERPAFDSARIQQIWDTALDRYETLQQAAKALQKSERVDFQSLLNQVDSVGLTLFQALQRADTVIQHIHQIESQDSGNPVVRFANQDSERDAGLQSLFQAADRNIAEYRRTYRNLNLSVMRTQGQAEVFITTIDALRIRILGLHLAKVAQNDSHREFVAAMDEAKKQLSAVEEALGKVGEEERWIAEAELEHGVSPEFVQERAAIQPPPPPPNVKIDS